MPEFSLAPGDPNSCPYTYSPGTLLTDLPPHPLNPSSDAKKSGISSIAPVLQCSRHSSTEKHQLNALKRRTNI